MSQPMGGSQGTVSPNRTVMIVLAYIWLLALIPLLVEKDDKEVQWHAKHGLVLMIAELVALFACLVVMSIVSVATFGLGCIFGVFVVFGWMAILALHVGVKRQRTPTRAAIGDSVRWYP